MELTKIISGGQTGADVAGLKAVASFNAKRAKEVLKTGGWCPANYMTVTGPNPDLQHFGLMPVDGTGVSLAEQYRRRSCANVWDADATLAFRFHASAGTDSTISYASSGKWGALRNIEMKNGESVKSSFRPLCVITCLKNNTWVLLPKIKAFLQANHVKVLNVCGHRDIEQEQEIQEFLEILFNHLFSEEK